MSYDLKVMVVFGTRPEAIKMCPLILELKKNKSIETVVCSTGQHKEMLKQVIDIFGIIINYDLQIMRQNQTLTSITASILEKIEAILVNEKPDIVLVHGDTTTSFASAIAAFYQKIAIGHVEAGLRTFDKYSPFPEEINRVLISRLTDLHFAPTKLNAHNLLQEGISKNIFITGNTVIDSFKTTVKKNYIYKTLLLNKIINTFEKIVLITAHRRENLGQPLENICSAIKEVSLLNPEIALVYPVHLNPVVRNTVYGHLNDIKNIFLLDPIDVEDMHNLMSRAYIVLTDSGGIQEEAPFFGVPVLVLRTETERPEAVEAGTVKVIGHNKQKILSEVFKLLNDKKEYNRMSKSINPYGDGMSSQRIVEYLLSWKKH